MFNTKNVPVSKYVAAGLLYGDLSLSLSLSLSLLLAVWGPDLLWGCPRCV